MALEIKKTEESQPQTTPVEQVERTRSRPRYSPPTDIFEKEDGLVLMMDMPGVEEKNVEVQLENGVLSVYGRVDAEEYGNHRLLLNEYGVGDYQRSFTVNEDIDTRNVAAELHNGVLKIFLPKAEEAKPRKITVKSV